MLSLPEISATLSQRLSSKRMLHSTNVMEMAASMAKSFEQDIYKAKIAGLLHDCAKDLPKEEIIAYCEKYDIAEYKKYGYSHSILHGPVGSFIARDEFEIIDSEILSSIYYHTTGKPYMTTLEKIIFLADSIEPNRKFKSVEKFRDVAKENLDKCMRLVLDKTISDIITKKTVLNLITVEARNYYLNIVKLQKKENL